MSKLSVDEQRRIIAALDPKRRQRIKKHCEMCDMRGDGFFDILKSVGKFLGPIAKEIGPTVLKELVVPFLKSKAGFGLHPGGAGLRTGGGRMTVRTKTKKPRVTKKRAPRKGRGLRPAGARKASARRIR